MLLSQTEVITQKNIVKVLGLVQGNICKSRKIGKTFFDLSKKKNIEIMGRRVVAESVEQVLNQLSENAQRIGAEGLIGVRYHVNMMPKTFEIHACGTAVLFEDGPRSVAKIGET